MIELLDKKLKIVALVPMKGHSERVPGKNMRPFCGRPLFHWIMLNLQNSKYISRIAIDTDSEVITKSALQYFDRVMIIDRPETLRGDFVPMNNIIAHDLSQIEGEHFLQTHSTNPLLTTATIDKAIECYLNNLGIYDSLFSVTPHQSRFYWQDGQPINHNPRELLRTQHLPPIYEENSNIYIFSRTSFAKSGKRRIGVTPYMFEMDKLAAVDIDDEQDFKLAEILCELECAEGSLQE